MSDEDEMVSAMGAVERPSRPACRLAAEERLDVGLMVEQYEALLPAAARVPELVGAQGGR